MTKKEAALPPYFVAVSDLEKLVSKNIPFSPWGLNHVVEGVVFGEDVRAVSRACVTGDMGDLASDATELAVVAGKSVRGIRDFTGDWLLAFGAMMKACWPGEFKIVFRPAHELPTLTVAIESSRLSTICFVDRLPYTLALAAVAIAKDLVPGGRA